jgi:post-segregation antitoxin (ccd killing protein)
MPCVNYRSLQRDSLWNTADTHRLQLCNEFMARDTSERARAHHLNISALTRPAILVEVARTSMPSWLDSMQTGLAARDAAILAAEKPDEPDSDDMDSLARYAADLPTDPG